jgi:hypothetical protein
MLSAYSFRQFARSHHAEQRRRARMGVLQPASKSTVVAMPMPRKPWFTPEANSAIGAPRMLPSGVSARKLWSMPRASAGEAWRCSHPMAEDHAPISVVNRE